jgi:hypothetical protein
VGTCSAEIAGNVRTYLVIKEKNGAVLRAPNRHPEFISGSHNLQIISNEILIPTDRDRITVMF